MTVISHDQHFQSRQYVLHLDRVPGFCRWLSVGEAATALRPFYFTVHPDLFGQHPKERSINEDSLKKLHQYIFALRKQEKVPPTNLTFFAKKDADNLNPSHVKIHLASPNIRDTVTTVLSSCQLPLDYINTIPDVSPSTRHRVHHGPDFGDIFARRKGGEEYYRKVQKLNLLSWIKTNSQISRANTEESLEFEKDVEYITGRLKEMVGLRAVRWHTNWGPRRYTACLTSLEKVAENHLAFVKKYLSGRDVAISDRNGVSLSGEVCLNHTDVPQVWLRRMTAVPAYDAVLERLPFMEKELSQLLCHIKIRRRERHHIVMAEEYELLLNKILNSMRRSQDLVRRGFKDHDLSLLEMVVEGPSAPLTLTNLGQYLIPVSMPGSMIVEFIKNTRHQAEELLRDAVSLRMIEGEVIQQTRDRLNLRSLEKDLNISPAQMTQCCERLIDHADELGTYVEGIRIRATQYYSVTDDGLVCIPWNWEDDN
ncbi:T-cell activation inhibitor, mitochondrial-like isoform X2 [Ostrea edulis]|uniref:T-cell activation inhibitor, mitochondrial-like isoform X2 n=1 Tax=Ostrea edulis TaxID=37623 RepID=UPI002094CA63|nr:T-cell activation inhibitor, mitochondrial-like isoform X2 [Ostrea edulis]